jgi:rhodanese-related sulfurtransferase
MIASILPRELAEARLSGKKVELLDVRTPVEFREIHVDFARNVPLDRLEAQALAADRNGSANETRYVICRTGNRSKQACEKLMKAGLNVDIEAVFALSYHFLVAVFSFAIRLHRCERSEESLRSSTQWMRMSFTRVRNNCRPT